MMSLKDTGAILHYKERKEMSKKKCTKKEISTYYENDCKVRSKVLLTEFSITIKKNVREEKFFFESIDDG